MFEKVNPAHPDKVADRIAGAIVDLAYKKEPDPKIAVEVLIGHGICTIILETSVKIVPKDIFKAVMRIAGKDASIRRISISGKSRRTDTLPITRKTESVAVITVSSKVSPLQRSKRH